MILGAAWTFADQDAADLANCPRGRVRASSEGRLSKTHGFPVGVHFQEEPAWSDDERLQLSHAR